MRLGTLPLILAFFFPTSAPAQSPDAATVSRLQSRVNGQQTIRVGLAAGRMVVTDPTLRSDGLSFAGRSDRIPLSEISEIEVRGSAWVTGALVGGAIGGASGLAFGLSTTRDCAEFFDIYCDTSAGEVVFATLVTGAFGAAVGGLIGLPIRKWKTVYRDSGPRDRFGIAVLPRGNGSVVVAGRVAF